MKADPKLEARAHDRIFMDGKPLTPEEREAAAVLVACHRDSDPEHRPMVMRAGDCWYIEWGHHDDLVQLTGTYSTPLAAWRAYREEVGDG